MKIYRYVISGIAFFSMMSSCSHLFQSHARVVKKQPNRGGVIAISQGMDGGANARMEANSLMTQNCNGQFEVTEESEVVVGQQGSQRTDSYKDKDIFDRDTKSSSTYSNTSDVTEWRITYKCKK